MGYKVVTDLAGISPLNGTRIEKVGHDKAYVGLGKFIVLKVKKEDLKDWLGNGPRSPIRKCYVTSD